VLHDTSGTATINTAAVAEWLLSRPARRCDRHHRGARAADRERHTVIKFAWAGDGNDTIIANDFGDTNPGGRGNDTIVAGGGADTLYGGPGSDVFVIKTLGLAPDTIGDFAVGSDAIDLHQLLTAIGYTGSNAGDGCWLLLAQDGSGQGDHITVDTHNGQGPQVL